MTKSGSSRRAALAFLLTSACRIVSTPADGLRRACKYLWQQQAEDGGWHSRTYGLLKSGQSLTPFVLNALLQVPEQILEQPAGAVDRAIGFLNRNTNAEGAVGKMDPQLYDYPNYASALTVLALRRVMALGLSCRISLSQRIAWLRTQQLTEEHGWQPDNPAYGGWGIGGEPRVAPDPGHVDLSMTRYVLQAFAAAGAAPGDPVFTRAKVFVERCQNPDGGFFFSTVVLDANKAGQEGKQYRSYGTTTADGILALLAMGAAAEDDRVKAARRWLMDHDLADGAPGFVGPAYQRWTAGLRFYYAAAGVAAFGHPNPALAASLLATQRSDGSWRNAENLVKEDDPLIATPFALMTLTTPQRTNSV
jgi:hypothetical protein